MGKRGPHPHPTVVKLLRGNPGRRALNRREPVPEGLAECPGWLLAEGKREWARMSPWLEKMGMLSAADRAAFAQYCQAWARWQQAEVELMKAEETEGITFTTDKGYHAQSPWVGMAQKWFDKCAKSSARFGFSPSDRAGLIAPNVKDDVDDMEALLG